jgi:hypothetical protein
MCTHGLPLHVFGLCVNLYSPQDSASAWVSTGNIFSLGSRAFEAGELLAVACASPACSSLLGAA